MSKPAAGKATMTIQPSIAQPTAPSPSSRMTAGQREALAAIRESFYYEIHGIERNDDGTLLLRHVGRGRERGTIRIRQWSMDLAGGLATIC